MKNKILIAAFVFAGLLIAVPASAQFGTPSASPISPAKQKDSQQLAPASPVSDAKSAGDAVDAPQTPTGTNPDLNGDGRVEFADLNILLSSFGKCSLAGNCSADLDDNRAVNEEDLDIMRRGWTGGPSSEIASLLDRCRGISDTASRYSCFLRLAQQIEIEVKEKLVFASIRSNNPTLADDAVETKAMERSVKFLLVHIHNLINRGYVTINRLGILSDRIESRIIKEERKGEVNLTESRRLLAEARVKLTEARGQIGEIAATYEKMVQTDPQALFESIRSTIDTVRDARRLLIEAVSNLKSRIVS